MEKDYHKKYYQKNKVRMIQMSTEWAKKNYDRVVESRKKPERRLAKKTADYRWVEQNREKSRLIKRKWQERNKDSRARAEAARRERIKTATPKWADLKLIKDFYKNRPENMSVDHIYPIKSDWVCGLHVIENLQYLPIKENVLKHNKRAHLAT